MAAAGKQLRFAVEAPTIARADRAAVRVDDQRQVAAIRTVRDGQVAMDALAVSGRESEGLRGCHCILVQPLPPLHQETCLRSEEHTSELQSLMRLPYAVFCL